MRRTWLVLGSVVAVVLLGFGTLQAVNQLAHGSDTAASMFEGDISSVEISLDRGSVRVVGSASRGDAGGRAAVTVTAQIDHGLFGTAHTEELVDDRLVLDASCPKLVSRFCNVDYTVEVPQGVAVIAHVSRGHINVSNVHGSVDLSTEHGDIDVERIGGDAYLSTRHGDVRAVDMGIGDMGIGDVGVGEMVAGSEHGDVTLDFTRAPREVQASSRHGDVEVVVPDGSGPYALDLSTDRGSTSSSVRTDPDAGLRIEAGSRHGDVTVRYP